MAAESVRSGGAFAQNPNSTPSGVEGSKSTLNTTDTSAATKLDPAPDAAEREAKSAWSEAADARGIGGLKYAEGVGGQGKAPGATNASGYSGATSGGSSSGPSGSTGEASSGNTGGAFSGSTDGGSSGGTGGSGGLEETANTAATMTGGSSSTPQEDLTTMNSLIGGAQKPKGKNLTEGGFEGEAQNNEFDIGSDKDPGRQAVRGFQNQNASVAGGAGPAQSKLNNETPYDALGSDQQA